MDNTFSERLKETRLSRELTQKQLAEQAQMAVTSYSSYEKGAKKPPLDAAFRLAQALNVSLDWLCGLQEEVGQLRLNNYGAAIAEIVSLCDNRGLVTEINAEKVTHHLEWIDEAMGNLAPADDYYAVVKISDYKLYEFFAAWMGIRQQYGAKIIDDELYQLWLKKRIKEAEKDKFEALKVIQPRQRS